MLACLVALQPIDPATGTRTTIYVSSVNDRVNGALVNGLNGQVWEPALVQAPVLGLTLWNGDFQAAVQPASASIPLAIQTVRKTWPAIDSLAWMGAPVTIYAKTPGTAWPWSPAFVGRVRNYARSGDTLTLTAEVEIEPLNSNLLTAAYAGTGGAEGGADLKNRVKPLALGWAKNVEPVLIDATNNVYQFSGYGAIEAVSVLYERGADFGAAVADHASYAALIAATIAPGKWATSLAVGMIRLGAPAFGVITGDIRGHKVGATTPRLTGAIINALATIAGVASGDIDTATLTALDSAVAYPINLVLTEQTTFFELARSLALACNYQSGASLTGKFFVAKVSLAGSAVLELDARGKASPQVVQSDEADVSVPYWRTVLGANRAWRVHSAEEIAFQALLVETGPYDAAKVYREGNVIEQADGARWLYINVAPTSGNAPPTWPTASNAWWSNLNPPTVVNFSTGVTGETKPDSNATGGENLLYNPTMAADANGWVFSGMSREALTNSPPSTFGAYAAAQNSVDHVRRSVRYTNLIPGKRFFIGFWYRANGSVSQPAFIPQADYFNAAGTFIGATSGLDFIIYTQNQWNYYEGSFVVPAAAASCDITVYVNPHPNHSIEIALIRLATSSVGATVGAVAGTNIFRTDGTTVLTQADIRTSEGTAALIAGQAATATSSDFAVVTGGTKPEANADVTSQILGVSEIIIQCDSAGVPLTGQLTKNVPFELRRQGVDVTGASAWARTQLSGSATTTMGAATGIFSTTAFTGGDSEFNLTATYGTTVRNHKLKLVKKLAAADPPSGGGTSQTVSVTGTVNSTTPVSVSATATVTAGSVGTVTVSCNVPFTAALPTSTPTSGTFSIDGQFEWWNGSAWATIGTVQAASQSCITEWDVEMSQGYIIQDGLLSFSFADTAPAANATNLQYRLACKVPSGTWARYPTGSITAVGS